MLSSYSGKFPLAIAQPNAAWVETQEEAKDLGQEKIKKIHTAQPHGEPGCQSSMFPEIENGSYRLCQS